LLIESLEDRRLLNADWQNPGERTDVNDDLFVSPLDVLLIINELKRNGVRDLGSRPAGTSGKYFDVDGDSFVAPIDVLQVINILSSRNPIVAAKLTNDSGSSDLAKLDQITNDPSIVGQISKRELGSVLQFGVGVSPTEFFDISNQLNSSGSFSLTASKIVSTIGRPLVDGSEVYTLRLLKNQNVFREIDIEFELDTIAPDPASIGLDPDSRLDPTNLALTSLSQITIQGMAQSGQAIALSPISSVTTAAADGSFSFNGLTVADGLNPFTIKIEDIAGNVAATSLSISKVLPAPASGGSIIVAEGNKWLAEHAFLIDLENSKGSRRFSFDVTATFDKSDVDVLVGDLLQVYLVDPMNPGTTLLDRGREGEALFSLSETGADFLPGLVTFNGTTVTVDLSSLRTVPKGVLVFQLINGDADENSNASIGNILNVVDEEGILAPVFPSNTLFAQPGVAVDIAGYNVLAKSSMQAIVDNIRVDGEAGTYLADLTLRNTGDQVSRALAARFNNLPAGVVLRNASGFDASGKPYLNLSPAVPSGGLDVGATTTIVELSIANPNALRFELDIDVLSAGPNRPPVLTPIITQTVMPGERLEIQLDASDPDGDRTTYTVQADRPLPRGSIDSGSGILVFSPTSIDLGTYQVDVTATDGALTGIQSFTLNVVADPVTTTRISGRILEVDQTPIGGMRVELGGVQSLTQSDGTFTLDLGQGPLVSDTLKIRGELFVGLAYPFIAEKLPLLLKHDVQPGVNNVIARPIFLPKLDIANGMTINPVIDTTVMSAALPGTSVFVAAGTLMNQQGIPFTGVLSITEVPSDLTPAALPENLLPDLVVTIQPGEMVFATPAPMTFPNRSGWAPGTLMNLWSINPTTGQFDDVGDMRVSTDGTLIETISGGVRNSSWHFPAIPPTTPVPPSSDPRTPKDGCGCQSPAAAPTTSETLLHSGALMETHDLVSYNSLGQSLALTMTYDSLRADPRPIVRFGYDNLVGDGRLVFASLQVSRGVSAATVAGYQQNARHSSESDYVSNGDNFHFWSTVSGDLDLALQADLRSQPSGRYDYALDVGLGRLQFIEEGFLPNGQEIGDYYRHHRLNGTSTRNNGKLISVNRISSPFGAGWGLNGLQQIIENPDRSVLLIDGDGSEVIYEPGGTGQPYDSPPGDFSKLEKLSDGSFRRTFNDQTIFEFNVQGFLASVADRNGNTTRYLYDAQGLLDKIVDPVGLETRFSYTSGRLETVTDPAARVTRMQYDASGNLTRITDPDGSSRTFAYDSQHHMVGEVDQLGRTETAQFGFHGRVTRATRKDGTTIEVSAVQVQGLLVPSSTSDPFRLAQGGSLGDAVAQYTDGQGNVFTATLDRAGQEVSASDAVGKLPAVKRNQANLITSSTDARGFVSEYSYDARGNLLSVSDEVTRTADGSSSHLFPGERIATGVRPLATAAGDFNGDGFSDLVTANRDSGDLSILLGNGDGTFAPERRFPTEGSPQAVTAGDVNGDGLLDLATTSYSLNGQVAVMLGAGDGTFSAPRSISTDGPFTSVTMGDLDHDGNVDIAAAGFFGTVYVMLGRGQGLFVGAQGFAVGFGVSSITAGDFNNDGALDLATSNGGNGFHSGSTVSVLLGNGDGSFAAEQRIETGLVPLSVTSGDFNGDGKLDLVTANAGDGFVPGTGVSVLTGLGDGTFSAPASFLAGSQPTSVVIGDFNGDGLVDLATANAGSLDVSVLLSHGNGTFAEPLNFSAGTSPGALTAADFNGDGTLDLAIPNSGIDVVTVLIGKGDGTMTAQNAVQAGGTPRSVTTGDFNGDGVLDLAMGNYGSGNVSTVSVRLGRGDGTFRESTSYEVGSRARSVRAGDFNGDGFLDLVTANNFWSSDLSVLLGNGDGTFAGQIRTSYGASQSLALGDFNGDGVVDLASTWAVLLGNADGTFASPLQFGGGDYGSVAAADFNGDRVLDLVVTHTNYHVLSVWLGKGDGTFSPEQSFPSGVSNPFGLSTGDFNGDGVPDVAVGGTFGEDSLAILLGNGDGTFEASRLSVAGSMHSIITGDFSGDGVLDLAVAQNDSRDALVLLGHGNGTFAKPKRFAAGTTPFAVTTGDFNGDGLLDLAVANQDSADVSVLLANPRQGHVTPPTFTYEESFNQLTSATDELGRQMLYEIDPTNGNRLSTRRAIGRLDSAGNGEIDDLLTTFTYTTFGLLDKVTDPLGRMTDYDYDPLGRLVATTFAVGTADQATASFEYDTAGNLIARIDELGHRTQLDYDSMNRLRRLVDPDPNGAGPLASPITAFAYDTRGNLIETTDAGGSTFQRQYDPLDRPVLSLDHLGNKTRLAYDLSGNLVSATDPNNHTTRYRYDARNRLTHLTDPDGGVTTFRYDLDDNLLALTDPVGNRTNFGYDSRNRLTFEVDPLGNLMRYAYDAVNNLTKKTDRSDRKTTYAYDELSRLVKETWVTGGNELQYAYDKASNLTSVADVFSSLAFTHDNRDRVKTVDNSTTPGAPRVVLNYTYDDVGNVLSVVDTINGSSGATTSYLYDALNRMTRTTQFGSGLADKRVDLAYNPLGQFSSIERYSDLGATQRVVGTSYTYDTLNRLTGLAHNNTTGPVSFYNFTYDSASRITRIADIDGATDYAYDDRDQLTGADRAAADTRGDEAYTYDDNGNRITSHRHGNGYVTGPGNRLLSDGTYNYTYDKEGNLLKRTENASGNYRDFEWDFRNRLIAVTDKTTANVATQKVTFSYDAFDRRISKAVDTTPQDAVDAVFTHFVYDREDVILDFIDTDGSGPATPTLDERYLHGPAVDQVLAQDNAAGSVQWYLTDHLGTVRDLVDNSGVVVNHIGYDSFGNVVSQTSATVDSRYKFTGREFDADTGLHYYRARYFDAAAGRFIGEDPIRFSGGDTNLHRYVNNNVISNRDPYGLEAQVTIAEHYTTSSVNEIVFITEADTKQLEAESKQLKVEEMLKSQKARKKTEIDGRSRGAKIGDAINDLLRNFFNHGQSQTYEEKLKDFHDGKRLQCPTRPSGGKSA
jgi:RHS repeat-associated protein